MDVGHMKRVLSCVSAAFAVLALAASALAGSPGTWTKVTDPGSNVDELGIVRSPNGLLHIAWPKVVQPAVNTEIWHTRIGPTGVVGGRSLISGKWNAAGGPKLIVTASGIRVFFAGLCCSNADGGIQSATAGHDGAAWTKEAGHVSSDVNAAGTVGATLLREGEPVFTWASGSRLFVHTGVDPNSGEQELGSGPACCFSWPELATDTETGVTTLAYGSIVPGEGGLFVRQVQPGLGGPKLVPKSLTGKDYVLPDLRLPLVARQGGGVFLAYCGGYPTCKQVYLWKVGAGAPTTVSSGSSVQDVNASRGPEGRLWIMWWDSAARRIFATRSNKQAGRFGPVVSTKLPPGSDHVWKLFGEGSVGPLDVLASVGNRSVYWHTQLLPKLAIRCSRVDKDTVSCAVSDAGDPIVGAQVRLGGQTKTTAASGKVTFTSAAVTVKATASRKGYTDAGT
jgi:hypothetical protein